METKNKQLPPLNYPFDNAGLNPFVYEAEEACETWIQTIYKPKQISAVQKSKASATLCGHFAARMYPTADRENLILITRFLLWGLINDDYLEDFDEETHKKARLQYNRILLENYNPAPDELPLFHQMAVIRDDARKLMPEAWLKHFADAIDFYMEGMIEELYYKIPMIWPTMGEYIRVRQKAVCVFPLYTLYEVSSGMMLPDSIYYSPPFQRLGEIDCNILTWTNDYYSVKKEQEVDVMNAVLIYHHWHKTDLYDAYDTVVKLHDLDVEEMITIFESLPDFGEHQETVDKFIENMKLCAPGQRDWYALDTHRYPLVVERN